MRIVGIVVATVVILVSMVLLDGLLSTNPVTADTRRPTATTPDRPARERAPQGMTLRICVDPSASTDSRFAASVRDDLAAAVGGHVPPRPAQTKAGVTGLPGLEVTIRLVSTRPLAYGEPYVDVRVPSVDGLPPRPDMTRPGALDAGGPYLAWKALERRWAADYDRALAAQAVAVDQISHLDLSRGQQSDVRDCVAALTTVPPAYPRSTAVVASDLEDNAYTGAEPDLAGVPLVVVQPCPDGDAARCRARFDTFGAWAKAHGAGPVDAARPEAAGATFTQLVSAER